MPQDPAVQDPEDLDLPAHEAFLREVRTCSIDGDSDASLMRCMNRMIITSGHDELIGAVRYRAGVKLKPAWRNLAYATIGLLQSKKTSPDSTHVDLPTHEAILEEIMSMHASGGNDFHLLRFIKRVAIVADHDKLIAEIESRVPYSQYRHHRTLARETIRSLERKKSLAAQVAG